ncbi:urea amidolyase [Salipiger sp. IMCC34102]|uniref:5-oxoprolinase subunit C family protein n=1 Tax=Salipiger sp. IMCC34102 TaxID=2510647 RepID=UPI00101DE78A|nr:urea amidolyase [Salipiger sp. IMCC34102]RYH03525.1 urea amidolyase [Salipiger sp. IMCC34102]
MTAVLTIRQAGPLMTVQDLGRPGHLAEGLSPGGAMDRVALIEAAALLGLDTPAAAIEMAGLGGQFVTDAPIRFALTGARMQALIDDAPLRWNATHTLHPGQVLTIGGARDGTYGYLTPAGGITGEPVLGSVAAHLSIGLGAALKDGETLPIGPDPSPDRPQMTLPQDDRMGGGLLRLMPGPQTDRFDEQTRARLAATRFHRSPRASRTGLPLRHEGDPFAMIDPAAPISDFILSGDLQITGDGSPFLMLAECQTVGGYPRIGSVIATDLARAAQAPVTAPLQFAWITTEEADALHVPPARMLDDLSAKVRPLIRDPARMRDLLSYQLIGGVTAGRELEPSS